MSASIFEIKKSNLLMIYSDVMIATRVAKELGYTKYILQGSAQGGGLAVAFGCLTVDGSAVLVSVPIFSDIDRRIADGRGRLKHFKIIMIHILIVGPKY